ncbi:hypothetical protein COCNU_06G013820 [Cocos nucifera]|uniref:DNA/RNA-binding protein Alba-like domain-containing protein n=1 Tax=Cocos nucifera TaxID=13894 RepID=A0A8K0IC16_COCNU|nr:hypothetical protein COCNU_06G013820 [Cocos nucifera]
MDRYQRVEKPRPESAISENEIRITTQGLIRNYVSYASSLLQEKRVREIVLKAMGQAISKTVAIAEIIKKRIPGLHQDTTISSTSITDVWEPIEEGLVPLEMTRHVSMISITLSTRVLNKNSPGYQAPLHVEQPRQQQKTQQLQQYRQQQPRQNHMAEGVVEIEEEEGPGEEADMVVMADMVDMTTTKKMDGTGIGVAVEVEVEEVGVIAVLDMKEAEGVEEDMAVGGCGRFIRANLVAEALWCLPFVVDPFLFRLAGLHAISALTSDFKKL